EHHHVAVGQAVRVAGERVGQRTGEVVAGPELGESVRRPDGDGGVGGVLAGPGADLGDRAVGHRGDLPGASSPASSIAAVTMSAVVSGSDISRGASRTVTPSTSSPAAGPSPGATSQPSRSPVPERAP